MELDLFANLIKETSGLVIKPAEYATIADALNARIKVTGLEDHNQYLDFILNNSDETNALIDLLTNNETFFFRERDHFQICIDRLIPDLLTKRTSSTQIINILSAGCSTGEEPYSIAISLAEQWGKDIFNSVSIVGFDINQNAIESAKKGIFLQHSFRESNAAYQEKYFNPISTDSFKLKPSLNEIVEFRTFNLFQDPDPSWLKFFDIIFYRNVSIYFNSDTKRMALNKLGDLLNDDGCVIMASAETFSHKNDDWFLDEVMGRFLYRKILNTPAQAPSISNRLPDFIEEKDSGSSPKSKPAPGSDVPPRVASESGNFIGDDNSLSSLFEQSLICAQEKKHVVALTHLDKLILLDPGNSQALNLKATILINLKRLDEAKAICAQVFKLEEWNLECYLLSGIIARMEGKNKEAFRWFKSVSYLQPSCWLSHMHLGELHESQKEPEGAYRAYSQALKHLEKHGIQLNELSFFPLAFTQEQLAHLFRHKLVTLKNKMVHF